MRFMSFSFRRKDRKPGLLRVMRRLHLSKACRLQGGFQLFGGVFDYAAIISDTLAAFVARLQREDEQQEGGKGQNTFHGLNG